MKIDANVPIVEHLKSQNVSNGQAKKEEKKLSKEDAYSILSQQDQLSISYLKGETDKNFQTLRDIVTDLLKRQGIELGKLKEGETVKIDEKAKAEAEKMIGPDGPLGAEKTAERIFQFAKSISGGDKSKLDKLRDAIDQGFEGAKKLMGGSLPDISKQTRELVNSKLDAWEKEGQAV